MTPSINQFLFGSIASLLVGAFLEGHWATGGLHNVGMILEIMGLFAIIALGATTEKK